MSDSEYEDNPSANVIVPQKLVSRGNIVGTQSSIRLSELGPRLTLQVNITVKIKMIIFLLKFIKITKILRYEI